MKSNIFTTYSFYLQIYCFWRLKFPKHNLVWKVLTQTFLKFLKCFFVLFVKMTGLRKKLKWLEWSWRIKNEIEKILDKCLISMTLWDCYKIEVWNSKRYAMIFWFYGYNNKPIIVTTRNTFEIPCKSQFKI